jgi:ABC-2 type transport system ATP-binding protein
MDPAGRNEILKLAQDLSRNKGMSLLFSSHLLPDVEAVCDYVMVLGRGKMLTQGRLSELKQGQEGRFQVRVKADAERFRELLAQRGVTALAQGEELIVSLPAGQDGRLLWRLAAEHGLQIRLLRPQRSTLEEVFLKAVRE